MSQNHYNNLLKAHTLAKKKFGSTFPNPVVGCIIVKKNRIISTGVTGNLGRPHAEEIALKKAGNKAKGATMYVTLEPCAMCLGAMMHARISRVVFGAYDLKTGVCGSCEDLNDAKFFNHDIIITGGILENHCGQLLKSFFIPLR